MPNHISNTIEILGSKKQVKAVRTFLKGNADKDGNEVYIDFNNIVRMPECLDIPMIEGGVQFINHEYNHGDFLFVKAQNVITGDSQKEQTKPSELALKYERNINETGHSTWYSWCCSNWGTKWNAYLQSSDAENMINFSTAWNGVPILIEKLSKKFPDIKFKYRFSDYYEGYLVTYLNGEVDAENFEVEIVKTQETIDTSIVPF